MNILFSKLNVSLSRGTQSDKSSDELNGQNVFQIIATVWPADNINILYQHLISTSRSQHVDRTHRDCIWGQWLDQGQQAEETVYSHLAGTVEAPKSTQL